VQLIQAPQALAGINTEPRLTQCGKSGAIFLNFGNQALRAALANYFEQLLEERGQRRRTDCMAGGQEGKVSHGRPGFMCNLTNDWHTVAGRFTDKRKRAGNGCNRRQQRPAIERRGSQSDGRLIMQKKGVFPN
jgi:hypothetical protein